LDAGSTPATSTECKNASGLLLTRCVFLLYYILYCLQNGCRRSGPLQFVADTFMRLKTWFRSYALRPCGGDGRNPVWQAFVAKSRQGIRKSLPSSKVSETWCTDLGWGYEYNSCPACVRDGVGYVAGRLGPVAAVRGEVTHSDPSGACRKSFPAELQHFTLHSSVPSSRTAATDGNSITRRWTARWRPWTRRRTPTAKHGAPIWDGDTNTTPARPPAGDAGHDMPRGEEHAGAAVVPFPEASARRGVEAIKVPVPRPVVSAPSAA